MDTQTGLGCEKEARVPEPLHFPGEVAKSGKGHKMGRTLSDSGPQCPCWKTEKGRYLVGEASETGLKPLMISRGQLEMRRSKARKQEEWLGMRVL